MPLRSFRSTPLSGLGYRPPPDEFPSGRNSPRVVPASPLGNSGDFRGIARSAHDLSASECRRRTGTDAHAVVFRGALCLASAQRLAATYRGKLLGHTQMSSDLSERKRELGLDARFDRMGPASKIRALSKVATPVAMINRYLHTGAQQNVMCQVQDIMSSLASGIQRWGSFSGLLQAPHFPPTAELARQWSAIPPWSHIFHIRQSSGQGLSVAGA